MTQATAMPINWRWAGLQLNHCISVSALLSEELRDGMLRERA